MTHIQTLKPHFPVGMKPNKLAC